MPSLLVPANQRRSISPTSSIRYAGTPSRCATSTRRSELDELREPITSIRSQLAAICLTAAWRLVVA
jgi:hypothetical protein